jgi:hypothetical protein
LCAFPEFWGRIFPHQLVHNSPSVDCCRHAIAVALILHGFNVIFDGRVQGVRGALQAIAQDVALDITRDDLTDMDTEGLEFLQFHQL